MKKIKNNVWEKVFAYPSFNIRFLSTFLFVAITFFAFGYYVLFVDGRVQTIADKIGVINTMIQGATLILGIFAAYYALRQLVETRFTELDRTGADELRRKQYLRAFEKWRQAFYVRPDVNVFLNASESLLLFGDYEMFDKYIDIPERKTFLGASILTEDGDKIIVKHLKALRNLLVKNQGEAEKYIEEIVKIVNKSGIPKMGWNFADFQTSVSYLELSGECKKIADNLVSYLQGQLTEEAKRHFEEGNYAYELTNTTQLAT